MGWIPIGARPEGSKLEPEGPRIEVGFPTADQGFSSIQERERERVYLLEKNTHGITKQ